MDEAFKRLTNYMNETLGHMLIQYHTLLTKAQCEVSYNNSKWRIIVKCTGCLAYEDIGKFLAMLISEVRLHLAAKSIHFEQTSVLSMLSDNRKLTATVSLGLGEYL